MTTDYAVDGCKYEHIKKAFTDGEGNYVIVHGCVMPHREALFHRKVRIVYDKEKNGFFITNMSDDRIIKLNKEFKETMVPATRVERTVSPLEGIYAQKGANFEASQIGSSPLIIKRVEFGPGKRLIIVTNDGLLAMTTDPAHYDCNFRKGKLNGDPAIAIHCEIRPEYAKRKAVWDYELWVPIKKLGEKPDAIEMYQRIRSMRLIGSGK